MNPQNRMISHIQDLSSFISLNEESVDAYSSFRWDYGDTEEFISLERARNIERNKYMDSLSVEYKTDNKEDNIPIKNNSVKNRKVISFFVAPKLLNIPISLSFSKTDM